jgi:hypothetical protein
VISSCEVVVTVSKNKFKCKDDGAALVVHI